VVPWPSQLLVISDVKFKSAHFKVNLKDPILFQSPLPSAASLQFLAFSFRFPPSSSNILLDFVFLAQAAPFYSTLFQAEESPPIKFAPYSLFSVLSSLQVELKHQYRRALLVLHSVIVYDYLQIALVNHFVNSIWRQSPVSVLCCFLLGYLSRCPLRFWLPL